MAALTSLCPIVLITAARLPVVLRTVSRNRVVRNTRRDPQGVEPSGVRFGIAFPGPSNDHTVNERKETAIPPPYLRRGPAALRMPDRSSGSFFSHRQSCCLARR